MRLTQLFTGEKKVEDRGIRTGRGAENLGKAEAGSTGRSAAVNRQIHSLTSGQTVSGEVLARTGSEIQIKLAGDMVLNARMDRSMMLEIGKNVTFEVKNNGASLMLSPLFENTAADANVLKALDMASLPVNETTIAMTEGLMKSGLPIDRNTLLQIYREINAFPQAEIADVIDLHRLGIPVEESSLNQIASYKNLAYRLGEGVQQLAEALPQVLAEMVQKSNVEGAAKLWQEIFTLLQESGIPENPSDEMAWRPGQPYQAGMEGNGTAQNGVQGSPVLLEGAMPTDALGLQMGEQSAAGDVSRFLEILKNPEGLQNTFLQGGKEAIDLVGRLFTLAAQGGAAEESILKTLHTLLSGKPFQEALGAEFQRQFGITPEEVAQPGYVEQFYEKLDRQVRLLNRALEEAGQNSSQAYRTANNLSQNLDFLQQINQVYTYVQLPLRLKQGRAHGDLYVFTNKKHLASADGKISALLHLDMEHLGAVDVYVAMEQERVSTKFYVQDDEMLDFIEEHIELLTKRLQQRGYNCSFSAEVREEKQEEMAGIRRLLEKEGHVPLAQHAFDMRA